MTSFPRSESVSELRRLGIEYALVSSSAYPDFETVNDQIEGLGLKLMTKIGEIVVYELRYHHDLSLCARPRDVSEGRGNALDREQDPRGGMRDDPDIGGFIR